MNRLKRVLTGVLILCMITFPMVASAEEMYGEDAYTYLRYIDKNFHKRINNKEITTKQKTLKACGEWISKTLQEVGYSETKYTGTIEDHEFTDYCFTKPGRSAKKVVIGAHYDSVDTNGTEDNGTGVSMNMELAKRFIHIDTEYTLEFCFFDGEEYRGFGGSAIYLNQCPDKKNIQLYINLDCVGSGDQLFAYGGEYEGDRLVRDWGYNMARMTAEEAGVSLQALPEVIQQYRTPTRTGGSDQFYFVQEKIPYIYFEANAWVDENGNIGNTEKSHNYNSSLPAFKDTNGQIIHTKYDNLELLEQLVPGRIQKHFAECSKVVTLILREVDDESPEIYDTYEAEESKTEPETKKTEVISKESSKPGSQEESVTSESESLNTQETSGSSESKSHDSEKESEKNLKIILVIALFLVIFGLMCWIIRLLIKGRKYKE